MAILTHTFFDKTNTIIEGDATNLGLNPIMELYYGSSVSRGLIHFDTDKLRKLVDDGVYPDMSKLRHVLKMQNVASMISKYGSRFNSYNDAERASSFDLIFFLINTDWDMGRGYDYATDGFDTINRIHTTDGSNWYQANNTTGWANNGIYSRDELRNGDVVIARQHFDMGNECINVDITDVVNDMIDGIIPNRGIGIAFEPDTEELYTQFPQYVGFFTDHTHTAFRPYLETTYSDQIHDDRANFYLDKDNRLYFYASVGHEMVNLDNLPTCAINGSNMAVKQATKGVYYIELNMDSNTYDVETMYYDVWSDINYKGKTFPDSELYFTTKSQNDYFSFGLPTETSKRSVIVPSVYGINHNENIIVGDIRKINVMANIAYTTKQETDIYGLEYMIYVKQADNEYVIIDWNEIDRGYLENFFYINTNELPAGHLHVAIKVKRDCEEVIYRDVFEFNIIDENINRKC